MFGDQFAPSFERLLLLTGRIERFAPIEQSLGDLRRFGEFGDQVAKGLGRLEVHLRMAGAGQVVVGQSQIEISLVELVELGVLGDHLLEGLAGFVVLLVFFAQIANALEESGLSSERIVGEFLEEFFPFVGGQIEGTPFVQRHCAVELPAGRLGGLCGRRRGAAVGPQRE